MDHQNNLSDEDNTKEAFQGLLNCLALEKDFDTFDFHKLAKEYYVKMDYSNSRLFFEKVLGGDHGEAYYMIGRMHEYGLGTEKDDKLARYFYEASAASLNYTPAIVKLGKQAAAQLEDVSSLCPPVTESADSCFETAADHYSKAKAMGSAEAAFQLGLLHDSNYYSLTYSGIEELQKHDQVLALYKEAASMGHAEAAFRVAQMHEDRSKICDSVANYKEAFHYYNIAAEKDHALSLNRLGYFYENGIEVAKCRKNAIKYYGRSARLGNPLASRKVGLYFLKNQNCSMGNEKNTYQIALHYLKKASDDGAPDCQRFIVDALEGLFGGENTDISNLREKYDQLFDANAIALPQEQPSSANTIASPQEQTSEVVVANNDNTTIIQGQLDKIIASLDKLAFICAKQGNGVIVIP